MRDLEELIREVLRDHRWFDKLRQCQCYWAPKGSWDHLAQHRAHVASILVEALGAEQVGHLCEHGTSVVVGGPRCAKSVGVGVGAEKPLGEAPNDGAAPAGSSTPAPTHPPVFRFRGLEDSGAS